MYAEALGRHTGAKMCEIVGDGEYRRRRLAALVYMVGRSPKRFKCVKLSNGKMPNAGGSTRKRESHLYGVSSCLVQDSRQVSLEGTGKALETVSCSAFKYLGAHKSPTSRVKNRKWLNLRELVGDHGLLAGEAKREDTLEHSIESARVWLGRWRRSRHTQPSLESVG
jgi:hypothetical protein